MPDTVFLDISTMTELTIIYNDRRNSNLVFLSDLLSEANTELYSMDVLTAYVPKLVIRARTSPIIRHKNNIIVSLCGLGMNVIVIVRKTDKVAFESDFLSFDLSFVFCHILLVYTKCVYKVIY